MESMKPSLDGPLAKIARARDHIKGLQDAAKTGVEDAAGHVVIEDEGEWKVVRMVLDKPLPIEISTILGDVIHNLRSSLDHLAWQLVLASGSKPGKWTSFPIYGNEADFRRDVLERDPSRSPGPLQGIEGDSPVLALVTELQPYNTPDPPQFEPGMGPRTNSLFLVHKLSVIDKHRHVHLCAMQQPAEAPFMDRLAWDPGVLVESRTIGLMDGIEDGTEIARLRFSGGPEPQVRVERPLALETAFTIEFSDGAAVSLGVGVISTLADNVEASILRFSDFF